MSTTKKSNQKTDLVELLDKIGVQVATVDREITCHCPFHEDRHPSFSMNAVSGLWICYQCGASGTLDRLLSDVSGESNPTQALREIKHRRTRRPLYSTNDEEPEPEEALQNPFYLYAKYESFVSPPAWALEERMIEPDDAEHYGLRWAKGWVIPIFAPRVHNVVQDFWGWQFKRLDYVSNYPKRIKKSQTLFGLQVIRSRTAVLVESPLDVVRLAACGVPAVASYGAFVSRYQVSLLEGRFDRITLALDNDREGKAQTEKLYPRLARKLPTRLARYPKGMKDPGDMNDAMIEEVFK